jgi:hypothetical protein
MFLHPALFVQRESAYDAVSDPHRISDPQIPEPGSELSSPHQLDKEFKKRFIRRGNDRIRPLNQFVAVFDRYGCILARSKAQRALRPKTEEGKVFRKIYPFD